MQVFQIIITGPLPRRPQSNRRGAVSLQPGSTSRPINLPGFSRLVLI